MIEFMISAKGSPNISARDPQKIVVPDHDAEIYPLKGVAVDK